jgi:hypothetical protein
MIKSKIKPRFSKLSTLKGLMAKYEVTGAQLGKAIGLVPSTVSRALNGHIAFNSNNMKNIQKVINQKEIQMAKSKGLEPHYYSIDEIFYS